MKVVMQIAFRYNKISIVEICINRNIRYVGEYQLKCKQSTNQKLGSEVLTGVTSVPIGFEPSTLFKCCSFFR